MSVGKIDAELRAEEDRRVAQRRAHRATWPAVKETARQIAGAVRAEIASNVITRGFRVKLKLPLYRKWPQVRYSSNPSTHHPAQIVVIGPKQFRFYVQVYVAGGNPPYVGCRYYSLTTDTGDVSGADAAKKVVIAFRNEVMSHERMRGRR